MCGKDDGIKKCSVCGKSFYPVCTDLWAYKIKAGNSIRRWFCSWGCMRKHTFKPRKPLLYEEDTVRTSHNSKAVVVIDEKTGEVFAEYPSQLTAATAFGLATTDAIKKRIITGNAYDGYIFKYKKNCENGK